MKSSGWVVSMVVGVVGVVGASRSPARAEVAFPHLPRLVGVAEVTATSTFADKDDAYAAWRTLGYELRGDGDAKPVLWSAWCEGRPDQGIGETVTVQLAAPTRIDSVKIAAGVWRTDRLFAANNAITALEVIADGKSRTVKPAGKRWVEVKIGAEVTTLEFRVAAVRRGRMNDSCISAIELIQGGGPLVPVIGVDAAAFAALVPALRAIEAALEAPGKNGLEPVIDFPFSNLDVSTIGSSDDKPTTVASWPALLAACNTYAVASSKAGDFEYVSPKGCPQAIVHDPDDDRPSQLRTLAPRTILVTWQSHREVVTTWQLVWKDRWKLQAISFTGY